MNAPLTPIKASEIIEAVITKGDIGQLSAQERAKYYVRVCESIGLNPMTRPFEYITLNGKLVLYARKDCTDQLRSIYEISVQDMSEGEREGVFVVTCKVANGKGRTDVSKGAVSIAGLKGEALANAMMKAETKAKRRATLSICGLGFLDETEVDDAPARDYRAPKPPPPIEHRPSPSVAHDPETGEIPPERGDVVWEETGERAATADDGIPPGLDRRNDHQQWLNDLAGALSGCEDFASLGEKQQQLMMPKKNKVAAETWKKAEALVREHLDRINNSNVMAAG